MQKRKSTDLSLEECCETEFLSGSKLLQVTGN